MDRSAAYAARWVAKNIVAAGLARKCEIQLAYAIGVAHPVSIMVESFGTGAVSDEILAKAVERVFDLRPAAIIQTMGCAGPSTGSWQRTAIWAGKISPWRGKKRIERMS